MTSNLVDLLTRLHQATPETCKCNLTEEGPDFTIGEFVFFFADGELYGSTHDARKKRIYVKGRPALAWLSDAIMAECEKRGWLWMGYTKKNGTNVIRVGEEGNNHYRSTLAEALLAALVAVVERSDE